MDFILVILIILLILVGVWYSRVDVKIKFQKEGENDFLRISARFFHLITVRKEIPLLSLGEEGISLKHQTEAPLLKEKKKRTMVTYRKIKQVRLKMKRIVDRAHDFYRMVRLFLAKIKVTRIDWSTEVGAGDAATSAILSGIIWSLKGSLLMVLDHYVTLSQRPNLRVVPNFQESVFRTDIDLSLTFPLGQAMKTAFQLLRYWRKGSVKHGRASHSRTHEYGDGEYQGHG